MAVEALPETATADVQAEPERAEGSVQAAPGCADADTQAGAAELTTTATQAPPARFPIAGSQRFQHIQS